MQELALSENPVKLLLDGSDQERANVLCQVRIDEELQTPKVYEAMAELIENALAGKTSAKMAGTAAFVLGEQHQAEHAALIVKALSHPEIQLNAAIALSYIGSEAQRYAPDVVEELLECCDSKDPAFVANSFMALSQVARGITQSLANRIGKKVEEVLAGSTPISPARLAAEAARCIGMVDPLPENGVERLGEYLVKHDDFALVRGAAHAAGELVRDRLPARAQQGVSLEAALAKVSSSNEEAHALALAALEHIQQLRAQDDDEFSGATF